MAKTLREWTTEQAEIFRFFAGEILHEARFAIVRAFAGTGKTSTIAEALLNYAVEVKQRQAVLYTTFARKNRTEAESIFADSGVTVAGIHQLGFRILKRFLRTNYLKATSWAETNRAKVLHPDIPMHVAMAVSELVGFLKNTFIAPTKEQVETTIVEREIVIVDKFASWRDKLADIALSVLELSKRPGKEISYEDMFWVPVALGIVKPEFALIVVDEAQDSNMPQMTMLRNLVLPGGRFVLVGDNHQAIYYFRGSMSDCLDHYKRELQACEFGLSTTFRCAKAIVKEAQAFVPTYKPHDTNSEGKVETLPLEQVLRTVKIGDVIISRTNAPLMSICLEFIRQGKPARIEGRDIGQQLRKIVESLNANDINELITKLGVWAQNKLSKLTSWDSSAKAQGINDTYETLKVLAEDTDTITALLARIETLFVDTDGTQKPSIVLSSTHKAKGLEWNKVVLLRDTFLRARITSPQRQIEETNLLYVGITRAREALVYTNSQGSKTSNQTNDQTTVGANDQT